MGERNARMEFSPRFEYIDKRDIRNAFALPRFDDYSKMREHNKPFGADLPGWTLFRPEPMTEQTFTKEEFESDTSSVSSQGSTGSSHGQPLRSRMTRGSRVHHIPILVEARDDNSSGYSSDTRSEENKQSQPDKVRQVRTSKPTQSQYTPHATSQSQYPPQATSQSRAQAHAVPAQRSRSDQDFAPTRPQPEPHPKKSASQPPSSPPAAANANVQSGPFITQVRLNAPVTVESKMAHDKQERKPQKPKPDPKMQITEILNEKEKLAADVEKFMGTSKDKEYRYLDEMLTRQMLKLDDVNTEGQEGIRQERRQAVKEIQLCITRLEQKLAENAQQNHVDQQDVLRDPPPTENGLNENGGPI